MRKSRAATFRPILFLLCLAALILLLFAGQKVLFMAFNAPTYGKGITIADWVQVVWHGLRLDLVSVCYLMVVPMVVVAAAAYRKHSQLRKWLTWWYVPAALAVTLAFAADMVLYHYWGAKLDVADMVYARNPKEMLASLSTGALALAIGGLVLLIGLTVALLRWVTPKESARMKRPILYSLLTVLLLAANLVGMRGGIEESTANPGYAYYSDKKFLNHAALNPFFNILSSMSKSENLAEAFRSMTEEEVALLTDMVYWSLPDIADTLLNSRRPDIVLVVWEGGGSLMTDSVRVAPRLSELKREGVYFTNCYANNFRTDRGLVSLLNGWPALPTTSVMKMSGRCGKLPSLARQLGRVGYHTAFYYGGDIDFTNMRGYLYETGYDQVVGSEGYAALPSDSKWGVHDHHFLRLENQALPPSPFFATYLTLSSHEPWEVPSHRLENAQANSFAYADSCIGAFVDQLRASPMWDNLLLIIVPDHGVACNGVSVADIRAAHIPMLWLGGAVRQTCTIDCLMNQSDLAATLMAQMGLSGEEFCFSRNVTSKGYQPTVVMHAFKNGFNLMDTAGCSQFECLNNQVIASRQPHSPEMTPLAKALIQRTYSATSF